MSTGLPHINFLNKTSSVIFKLISKLKLDKPVFYIKSEEFIKKCVNFKEILVSKNISSCGSTVYINIC